MRTDDRTAWTSVRVRKETAEQLAAFARRVRRQHARRKTPTAPLGTVAKDVSADDAIRVLLWREAGHAARGKAARQRRLTPRETPQ